MDSRLAERSVLGAILLDPTQCAQEISSLQVEDFHSEGAGDVFKAIKAMILDNVTIDVLSVSERLKIHGYDSEQADKILMDIASEIYTTANISSHAALVREYSARFELHSLVTKSHHDLMSGADSITVMATMMGSVDKIRSRSDGKNNVSTLKQCLADYVQKIQQWAKGTLPGNMTGLEWLDKILGGFRNNDLIILAGRPGTGKSALAMQIAKDMAKRGRVIFESLEMSREQLAHRTVSSTAGIDGNRIERSASSLTKIEGGLINDAIISLKDLDLHIAEGARTTVSDIRARALRLSKSGKLGIVIVDYLQLVTPERQKGKTYSREQEISEISRGLKNLASELKIPVLALSQLSRSVEQENRPPRLSDLRESGSLEQDASVVLFTYQDQNKNDIVMISKNRHGMTCLIDVEFEKQFTRFREKDYSQNNNFMKGIEDK